MNDHRLLRALSYISVLFAPIIFPLIVWMVSDAGSETQADAKNALLLHIIPGIVAFGGMIMIGITGFTSNSVPITTGVTIPIMIVIVVVDLGLVVYNLYKGIKLLAQD